MDVPFGQRKIVIEGDGDVERGAAFLAVQALGDLDDPIPEALLLLVGTFSGRWRQVERGYLNAEAMPAAHEQEIRRFRLERLS